MRALGPDLPEQRPGCGSLTADPNIADELAIRLGGVTFKSRNVEIGGYEDEHEACFDRDWTDGLPVVPPTPVRVLPHAAGDEARSATRCWDACRPTTSLARWKRWRSTP